jgi:putative phage-type endonuclease
MIKVVSIPHGTPQWHKFRESGIGGSEVSTLLDLNPYGNRAKMFYEKIGMIEPFKEDNAAMFHGRRLEDYVLDLWQYWDGTTDGYIANANQGKKQRKFRKVDGYVINSKYPYMFASYDAEIEEGSYRLDDGSMLEGEDGVLECKTISSFEANRWTDGIPRGHIAQVHHYFIVGEKTYGEIAMLRDGRHFDVFPVPYSQNFANIIIGAVNDFWEGLVLPGKEYKLRMDECIKRGDKKGEEKWLSEILSLEPSPSPGDSYKQFITERYQKEREEQRGNLRTFVLARRDLAYREIIKRLTEERGLIQNTLIKTFTESKSEYLRFDDEGYIRFFTKKGGKTPQLDNRIAGKADEELIEQLIKGIDINILK